MVLPIPMTQAEMKQRKWDELDFLFISGDAYVDHPSFSTALIARWLEHLGYRVGIVAQPRWDSTEDIASLGRPKLGVLVNAGNLDSMLCHYTAAKNRRSDDKYTPGGEGGKRPDRAVTVYSQLVKKLWPNMPVIIGGVEASLRRFAHYDYWADKVMPSILVDSQADLIIYGMGERAIQGIAENLAAGIPIENIHHIPGTCFFSDSLEYVDEYLEVAPFEAVSRNKKAFASAFKTQYWEQDPIRGKAVVQGHNGRYLVQLPPSYPLAVEEMDTLYQLPFTRAPHPSYGSKDVPALEEVLFSITSHRGCFGSCSFCAISSHQGRIIQNRSQESILIEAEALTNHPGFKGYIHDVGGPSANFRHKSCEDQMVRGACKGKHCLSPEPCAHLEVDHSEYMSLLRKVRALPKVKKAFIRSGIRYDFLLCDPKSRSVLKEIVEHHVSGQLKVAPEHISPNVLAAMGKPGKEVFLKFKTMYEAVNKEVGKNQFLVPYLISSHPGATLKEAVELAEFLRDINYWPEQVQDFIPTPGSLSTAMYWSGINPLTGEEIYVARSGADKIKQRVLLQTRNPKNRRWVLEALREAGREDLIGRGHKCLVADFFQGDKEAKKVEAPENKFKKKETPKKELKNSRSSGKTNRSAEKEIKTPLDVEAEKLQKVAKRAQKKKEQQSSSEGYSTRPEAAKGWQHHMNKSKGGPTFVKSAKNKKASPKL